MLLWFFYCVISSEVFLEGIFEVVEVGCFLSFLGWILIELGPGSSTPIEFLKGWLMFFLLVKSWVLERLFFLIEEWQVNSLELLGIAKSRVEHSLIVPDQSHLSIKSFIPMILRFRKNVWLFLERSGVWLVPSRVVVHLRVLSQICEESPLAIGWLVHRFKSARAVWDIRISSSSIVRIVNWFRVDQRQWLRWSLLCCYEWA